MPKKQHKKSKEKKSQSSKNPTTKKKKSKKKKKSNNNSYEWWMISSFVIAIISILLYFTLYHQTSLSTIILGQPKTPAANKQIDELSKAITSLQSAKINELTSKYEYNFDSHPQIAITMNDFFANWSSNIHDNKYSQRLDILRLLMNSTQIESLCLCNQLAEYRIIDALKFVLTAMSFESIKQCFIQNNNDNHNNIFHQVSKSKAASFARQLLKLGSNNHKLIKSFERLYIFMKKKQKKLQHRKSIVSQSNIKAWTSQIDIELIVEYALKANINMQQFFFAKNNENYTGFDYWILNHGQSKMNEFLKQYKHLFDQYLKYNQQNKTVQNNVQYVNMKHCNMSEGTLQLCGDNSCFPPVINDWNDFDIYWEQQRPVIIRAGDMKRNKNINLTSLMEKFGDLSMMVSEIPYAPLFGMKAWSIPIKEYINVILNGAHNSNMYAFDKALISTNEELRAYFNYSVQYMNDKNMQYVKTYQLALGPSTSGSPPHWHPPAFNQVFIGRKLWWMFSPKNSFFSSMNVMQWVNQEYKNKKVYRGEKRRHYCFIQQVGDVVFVPNEWSHATNNLQTTLAIAIEFS